VNAESLVTPRSAFGYQDLDRIHFPAPEEMLPTEEYIGYGKKSMVIRSARNEHTGLPIPM